MNLNSIFLIENGTCKRLESYNYEAEEITQDDLQKKEIKTFSRYAEINPEHFPTIKKNQVAKYIRENKSFLIKAIYKAYDKTQKTLCDSWDESLDLYLSKNDIKSIEERERPFKEHEGKTAFEKYYIIELLKPLFYTKGGDLKLFKDFFDIPDQIRGREKYLKDHVEDVYNFWKGKDLAKAEKLKKAYEEAMKEGFIYFAVVPSKKKESCVFTASCGFVRYETTKEYEKAEKLAKAFNQFLYRDSITTKQMYEILKCYKISKRAQ